MSSLFQAITRPADDFLEVRSSMMKGRKESSKIKTKKGFHKITLIDHTTEDNEHAENTHENNGAGSDTVNIEGPSQEVIGHSNDVASHYEDDQRKRQKLAHEQPNAVLKSKVIGDSEQSKPLNEEPAAVRLLTGNESNDRHEEGNVTVRNNSEDNNNGNDSVNGDGSTDTDSLADLTPQSSSEYSPLLGSLGPRGKMKDRTCMTYTSSYISGIFYNVCCCMCLSNDSKSSDSTYGERLYNQFANSSHNTHHGYSAIPNITPQYKLKNTDSSESSRLPNGVFSSDPNVKYDTLYENQRGLVAFGTPFFSKNSLLNFDPPAWVDANFNYSPVDILSAPVPDPSWKWVWRTWYVDMTGDVDDQGWSYSLNFSSSSWHGSHIWFHSLVRRRRWIRKRCRIPQGEEDKEIIGPDMLGKPRVRSVMEGHAQEYFAVQSRRARPRTDPRNKLSILRETSDDEDTDSSLLSDDEDSGEKASSEFSMASLLRRLRKSRLDREKIEAVEKFTNKGGEDIVLLSNFMHEILSFLIFQESRRELLRCLLFSYRQLRDADECRRRNKNVNGHQHEPAGSTIFQHPGHSVINTNQLSNRELRRRRKALHDAIVIAKNEILKLDYYSDRKVSTKEYAKAGLNLDDIEITMSKEPRQNDILKHELEKIDLESVPDAENDMEDTNDANKQQDIGAVNSDDDAKTITQVDYDDGEDSRKLPGPVSESNLATRSAGRVPLGDFDNRQKAL
ncbi:hypothetical protein V1511DRAFT_166433 [Dipodascopsis uninucleata]